MIKESKYAYAVTFLEMYLTDIKVEFNKFGEGYSWTAPTRDYDSELILPIILLENKKLIYHGKFVSPIQDNPIVTDPFRILIVSPNIFYDRMIKELRAFINDFKSSLDKKIRDSFKVEVKKGRLTTTNIRKPNILTLDRIY